ncbi:MAG: hypothetical protein K0S96_1850 [Geminicoccaceae bacterium]|jgi:hypothetical protein|nr:hypothetical protein [Geminicoccaceae bacterium]
MSRREKNRPELTVRVSFETTRFSTQCLVEAYECLAPSRRRVLRTTSSPAALAEEVHAKRGQGGKHA